jgi:hypothetical protein
MHEIYLLHISATHVAIFREVHYKGQIHQNITRVFEPMQRYKILNFKNNTWFKIHTKIKIQIKICDIDSNV